MKSMTGYGCGESVSKGAKIFVELSSVNRRQVEVALSLPSEIEALEPELRKILLASVSRGRVSGRVTLERPTGKANRDIIINEAQATVYKTALRKLADEIKVNNDISLESLLRLPGVLETVDKRIRSSSLLPALKKALKQALSQLQ
ncbi:MAG: YicC/YloC family endoribonuclease, partial [Verrucomicrobiota bacterium]|nr:YicC/YloC family endoribonuclease [Verrucomicrobiota bacterium]